jgi:endonuclease G
MTLDDILKDEELKSEILDKLAPRAPGGLTRSLVGRAFQSRVSRAELRKFLENYDPALWPPFSDEREAVIRLWGRPVLFIRNNSFGEPTFEDPDSEVWSERLKDARAQIEAALPSVGSIAVRKHPLFGQVGTGWLVREDVVLTCRHVAALFCWREGKGFVFQKNSRGQPCQADIDFRNEYQQEEESEFRLIRPLYIEEHGGPDLAFFQVTNQSAFGDALSQPIPLAPQPAVSGMQVAVAGYPGWDGARHDPPLLERIFQNVFDVKRLAPGVVTHVQEGCFSHDCSTLKGNSGSAVLDLRTGKALGIHYQGAPFVSNEAVPAHLIADRLAKL